MLAAGFVFFAGALAGFAVGFLLAVFGGFEAFTTFTGSLNLPFLPGFSGAKTLKILGFAALADFFDCGDFGDFGAPGRDGTACIAQDGYLEAHRDHLRLRRVGGVGVGG